MIGLMPTYLSSTTSRANSSRSSGSSIAAPPHLITTVLPWNSLMYGSASSSVRTSRISTPSCRVLRAAATRDHARDPPGTLAVGDHHDRELAQQRVERFAETQLVLALGRDAHAARARAEEQRGVVRR